MVNRVEKIIGSAEKIGSVGNRNQRYFFRPYFNKLQTTHINSQFAIT